MNDKHAYIFDRTTGRSLAPDGEASESGPLQLEGVLHYLSGDARLLRLFAIWCAEQVVEGAAPSAEDLLEGARRSLSESIDLRALRAAHEGTAIAASVVGLRHGAANAAAFLAIHAAADPDPLEAARAAAGMVRLHAELRGDPAGAAAVIQQQLDWLLDHLGQRAP